jgi:geranylgeranyl pyrophosphate synthase
VKTVLRHLRESYGEATEISKVNDSDYEELNNAIAERCEKIFERFRQEVTSQVKNTKLLAILEDVKIYWRDTSRPALASFSCEAVGGQPEAAENASLMLSLASSGFGIHDDILDRSSNKHLRMTIPGLHGVDSALLVGDLLIMKAWTTVHEMIRKTSKPTKIADIVEVYGNSSIEICEAEFMETLCRKNLDVDLDYYIGILWKAMAETEACSKIGAIMGDGKAIEVEALSEFGRRIGFMSRLADDIEDCLNLKGDLIHRIEYESVPLPLLYAAKSSKEKYLKIKKIIEKSSITPFDARELLKCCFETESFEYICKIAKKNGKEAIRNLCTIKPCKARNVLSLMAEKSYGRIAEMCI